MLSSSPKQGRWTSQPLCPAEAWEPFGGVLPPEIGPPRGLLSFCRRMKGSSSVGWSSCPVNPASEPPAPRDPLAIASVTIRENTASVSLAEAGGWLAPSHIFCAFCSAFQRGLFLPHRRGLHSDPVHADLQGLCCRARALPALLHVSLSVQRALRAVDPATSGLARRWLLSQDRRRRAPRG